MLAVPGGAACPRRCRLTLPLAYFYAPYPPQPPSPAGKGVSKSLFRRGLRPRHPCIRPFAALTASAMRAPRAREPAVRRNTDRSPFLSAVPAAKERGGRGRWNYPSLTRRRRLRWSSPPGQGEQVPLGFSPRRVPSTPAEPARQGQAPPRRHHSGRAIRRPEPAPPIPPPSAPRQPSPQGRRQAPPPEASAGKTQAPARQPFRQQRRGKIRSSTG